MTERSVHLYNRSGFGIPLSTNESDQKPTSDLGRIFSAHAKEKSIQLVAKPEVNPGEMKNASEEGRKKKFQKSRAEITQLNVAWLKQMTSSEAFVREKMTLFWHDHFACRIQIPYLVQQQNNVIRRHALGSFRDLLMAVSKDAAMLQFLNNQQNRKDSPNENFAREVLELFTLGRGNYTENDIKNAARSFTGWAFSPLNGEFVFRSKTHDGGVKEFRGKHGNFTGEDIISMVLEDKQTARFITEKIWSYFVSTDVKDEAIISRLASEFYKSDYSIEKVMKSIYSADWFYDARFKGNRIKSPVELLSGIQTHTGGSFEDATSSVFAQRALGQILFYPPNVGGWPTGKEWIDSSSLTFRMSLPSILFRDAETDFQAKDDGDVNNLTNDVKKSKITFMINWSAVASQFVKGSTTNTLQSIESFLLTRPTTNENKKLIEQYVSNSGGDLEYIKRAFTGFMSLPEYQLS
jgi:uncharacterized protein (DUF1800 family)